MSFPKHAKYRDSGVEWLGQIPSHWRLQPLKRHARQLTEKTDRRQQPVALENIESWTGRFIPTESEFEGEGVAFDSGDILFGKLRPYLAKALVAQSFGEAVGDFIVMRLTDQAFSPFVAYQLRSREVVSIVDGSTFGSKMPRASWDFVGALPLPLPPCDEQVAITAFLDAETAKIDSLVEEQRRLIELLKEKRQAVISQAVTKGLNPNAPMKDSGVEWLGRVPAHWGVGGLGYLAAIDSGATPDRDNPDYWNGNIPWIKTGEVNYEPIAAAEEHITEFGLTNTSARLAKPGTLLMAMYGQGATRGRVSILEIEAAYNQACAAIRFRDNLRAAFGYYFLLAAYEHVRDSGNETSQMNLSTGVISKFKLPVPPLHEQDAIVSHLDQQLRAIDGLLAEARAAAQLLGERRAALISAAVTGKIDLRDSVDLLTAWAETKADIAAGRFVSESAKAHVARARAMAKRDD